MLRQVKLPRWMMIWALVIFLFTAGLAIAINCQEYGWHWSYSISRYVALETWSAALFAFGNIFVAGLMGKYLFAVGADWKMPRWFYWAVLLTAVTLVGLSACPIGYFDRLGMGAVPSRIHELCSRLMFVCMAVMALTVALRRQSTTGTRLWSLIFVVYGVVCGTAFLMGAGWLLRSMLGFESAYIIGFMVICMGWRNKLEKGRQNGRAKIRQV